MFFLKVIEKTLSKGASILDAGCGVGDMIGLLRKNYCVVGVDSSEDALRYCTQKAPENIVIRGDISVMPFKNESFDGIISLDVLYHAWVRDDSQALWEMYQLLKPGGKLFLQLPAYEWLRSSHDEWSYTSRRYTTKKVNKLLKTSGFVKKKLGYRVCFLFPLAVIQRRIVKAKDSDLKEMPSFLNVLFKMIMSVENLLVLYVNFPFGLSVIGIAEKPTPN